MFTASDDHGQNFIGDAPPLPTGAPHITTGRYISLDQTGPMGTPSRVYVAVSVRGQVTGTGMIFSNPDPFGSDVWKDEKLPAAATNDPLAMGVGHDANGAGGNAVILVSITNNGLWRKVGSCDSSPNSCWSKVTGTAPFSSGGYGTIDWVPGSPTVYAVDSVGAWRSDSAGAQGSWIKLASSNAGYDSINALALDPTDSHVVYVSDSSGVARIDNADAQSGSVKKPLYSVLNGGSPDPIATDPNGTLFVGDRSGKFGSNDSKLMVATHASSGSPSFVSSGNDFFANNAGNIRSLAVSNDDYVYTADNGQGLMLGTPGGSGSTPTPTPTPSPTSSVTPTPTSSVTPSPTANPTPTPTSSPTPTPSATPTPSSTPVPTPTASSAPGLVGDFNQDGHVDARDLSVLLSRWHSAVPYYDLNNDGVVNAVDLSILIAHWTG